MITIQVEATIQEGQTLSIQAQVTITEGQTLRIHSSAAWSGITDGVIEIQEIRYKHELTPEMTCVKESFFNEEDILLHESAYWVSYQYTSQPNEPGQALPLEVFIEHISMY